MSLSLPGLTLEELTRELGSRARALETVRWLFSGAVVTRLPDELAGVSQPIWKAFRERASLVVPMLQAKVVSALDGTTKFALAFDDALVETVRIPAEGRSTICVSSQAGCTRRCTFCATKELGFKRNLLASEMVAQFLVAREGAPLHQPASNVVFMGMGEPMDNLDEVLHAVEVLTQNPAPQLKATSVTVSTSGVVPGMRRFLRESKASLALSLNATTDEQRERLMPHTRTWPIAELLEVLREEAIRSPRRHTFVEYVLFEGVNDTDDDAARLVTLLYGLPARVNIIPWNPCPTLPLSVPSRQRVLAFHDLVARAGLRCLVRWPRGQDIAAACGQLVLAREAKGFVAP